MGVSENFFVSDSTFRHPSVVAPDGLLGLSDELRYEDLKTAYRFGIFPVNNPSEPILWWSPDPRWILLSGQVFVSKSMRKILRDRPWRATCDTDFELTMHRCAEGKGRKDRHPSWITGEYIDVYKMFFLDGRAHSFEVWDHSGVMIGGLYGVLTGSVFVGESMFSDVSNTSKYAFILACNFMHELGIEVIDCQMHSEHLESLGAIPVRRDWFLNYLKWNGFEVSGLMGSWEERFRVFMESTYGNNAG